MTVRALREMGHDVRDIRGTEQEGITDVAIWQQTQREGRVLVTTDRGFAQYRHLSHYGILIVLLRQPNRHKIHQRVLQALNQFAEEEWPGLLVVMRDQKKGIWRAAD